MEINILKVSINQRINKKNIRVMVLNGNKSIFDNYPINSVKKLLKCL